jgi:hypothetical protein
MIGGRFQLNHDMGLKEKAGMSISGILLSAIN